MSSPELEENSEWKSFKKNVEDSLLFSLDNELTEIEPVIHTYLEIRKRNQKAGKINKEEVLGLWEIIETKYSKYLLEIDTIVCFINERLPVGPVKTNVGRTR